MPSIPRKLSRVVLVTGKGGVGKTTVAAALARAAGAGKGGSVLVEFGDGEAGKRALGGRLRGVEHEIIAPHDAVVRMAGGLFGSTLVARAVLNNFAMKRFFSAAPSVRELAMLESVRRLAEERPRARIVVDMPATGHGVAWLRVPAMLRTLFDAGGSGYALADRLCRELVCEGRVSIVVVTLPERLVLRETLELWKAIERDVGIVPGRLVVNRFPVALPEAALADAQAMARGRTSGAAAAAELATAVSARETARNEAVEVLREALHATATEPLVLPDRPVDPTSDEAAGWLTAGGLT